MGLEFDAVTKAAVFEYLLRLGDDQLVLGHRLSEWCGHAPILEEDIALANIALDCLGQASAILRLAGTVEGKGRTDDQLAYFREAVEFKNVQLVELPCGDFAFTIARQFFFDSYCACLYEELRKSVYPELAAIAEKATKEVRYHLRHSSEWMLRLGDGTSESRQRLSNALDEVWGYTPELFVIDEVEKLLIDKKIAPDLGALKAKWHTSVSAVITAATLTIPDENRYIASGGRSGKHSEHLGYILAEMQIVARSFPGARW